MNEEGTLLSNTPKTEEQSDVMRKRGGVRKRRDPRIKTPKRDKVKYPELHPELSLKNRAEEVADIASYSHKLNDEEKAWLNEFSRSYISAKFDDKKESLLVHENEEKARAFKKLCYDRNNARNRCIQTRETVMRDMISLDKLREVEILQTEILDDTEEV